MLIERPLMRTVLVHEVEMPIGRAGENQGVVELGERFERGNAAGEVLRVFTWTGRGIWIAALTEQEPAPLAGEREPKLDGGHAVHT